MFRAKAKSFGRELVSDPITRAFAISLLLHFLVISGVELGRSAGFWRVSVLPKFLQSNLPKTVAQAAAQRQEQARLQAQRQPPEAELIFVDVDPTQAQPEAPKDAKYYSSQNTVAANTTEGQKDKPKLDGTQKNIAKVKDTPRPDPNALHPSPQPAPKKAQELTPAPPAKAQPKKKAPEKVSPDDRNPPEEQAGETLLARATPRREPRLESNRQQPRPAPRHATTLAEAKANKGILEGKQMKQEGGMPRLSMDPGLDVKATPFGAYDTAFIMAVQARWFSLLDERNFVGNETGKVVVEFRLHQDGRITDIRVSDSQVSELLSWFCQRAVLDPAPYKPFPSDLRRLMDSEYREIRFTFYYNQ
jgi:hypothetical protein